MNAAALAIGAVLVVAAGCSGPPPVPTTPARDAAGAPVVRRAVPEPATPAVPSAAPVVVPPDAQYVCVSETNGTRAQTVISFDAKVAALCRRHPEMGPCQYERNLCRQSGGRVYAQGGVEITMDTEAEYDRRVMRVRFKAN